MLYDADVMRPESDNV